ncbi:reverse transcriptase domain-containing protein [Tanacetum coccineum]
MGTFHEEEITDEFPDEHLMILKAELNNSEPCASITGRKVYESGFYWPSIFKDAKDYVIRCDACQRSGNISSISEMPQNNIHVEAQALPTNDARVMIRLLRRLFVRFGVPKALINLEWYEALEDSELKDEALRNNAIMEGFIKDDDDESRSEQMKRWNIYANYDDAYEINHEREELCEVRESPVCNVRRYMMIKYSFNNDDEYVAIKENKYDDLTITRKEVCLAHQEIFRIMDEGWMVTRAE